MEGNFQSIGKMLILAGAIIIALGAILIFFNKIPFLGKMPGDILIKKDNFTLYFPVVTSIILSLLLTLIFYIISKLKQ